MKKKVKKFVYKKTHKTHIGEVIDRVNEYDVIECKPCGFKHVIPIPTDKELEEFYGREFYSHVKPKYFSDYEEDLPWWMETYKNHYSLFAKQTKGRKLLDVGSGPGYFLKAGEELGWDVLGFEPSKDAAEYSRKHGVKVVNDFFSSNAAAEYGKFDVVHMNTVIEHVPDPLGLIDEIKKVLKPGGIFCVISPNDYNPLQNVLRDQAGLAPWWVSPPQHLNYFDFKSIAGLLKKKGLVVVDMLGTFPMEFFPLSGDNYVGDAELGRKCQLKRKTFESRMYAGAPEVLNDIYRALGKNGIGRQFILIAKKPK